MADEDKVWVKIVLALITAIGTVSAAYITSNGCNPKRGDADNKDRRPVSSAQPVTTQSNQPEGPTSKPGPITPPLPPPVAINNSGGESTKPIQACKDIDDLPNVKTNPDKSKSDQANKSGLELSYATPRQFELAKKKFWEAAKFEPANAEAIGNLGWVCGMMGDSENANRILRIALSRDPNRRATLNNLGFIETKLGRDDDAKDHWCRFVKTYESVSEGKLALKRLTHNDPSPEIQTVARDVIDNCR